MFEIVEIVLRSLFLLISSFDGLSEFLKNFWRQHIHYIRDVYRHGNSYIMLFVGSDCVDFWERQTEAEMCFRILFLCCCFIDIVKDVWNRNLYTS